VDRKILSEFSHTCFWSDLKKDLQGPLNFRSNKASWQCHATVQQYLTVATYTTNILEFGVKMFSKAFNKSRKPQRKMFGDMQNQNILGTIKSVYHRYHMPKRPRHKSSRPNLHAHPICNKTNA
jgi:hypothetical protein